MEESVLQFVHLNDTHVGLGAKMVPFAGFNMPVLYTNLIEEHVCVRNNVGVFDVSHMGEFVLKGEKALDLIQYVCSNDASKLTDGKVQYSCLPNASGGIVDDLLVYRVNAHEYFLVVNASNVEKDWNWISSHNTFGVEMLNRSNEISLFAVQGPNAQSVLQKLTDVNLSEMPYYTFKIGNMAGFSEVIISNTGYTGAGGFEIYVENKNALAMWNAIFKEGETVGIQPVGLGARDTLRTEMGYCLYGHDIDDTTSPIEAGLSWITSFSKDFIMKDFHAAIKAAGPKKKLVGFEMIDRGIPRQHYPILNAVGEVIGEVTSGTQSPNLSKGIGMGYVETSQSSVGSEVFISIRDKALKAQIVKMPFI
jgi:aminomethyltransferase